MPDKWKWQRREKKLKSRRNKMPKHGKGQAQLYADVIDKKVQDLEKKRRIIKEIDEFALVASQQKLPKYGYGRPSNENTSSFVPQMKEFNFLKAQIKHYIEPNERPPKGVTVQTGKRGGKYYVGDLQSDLSTEIASIPSAVKEWNKSRSNLEKSLGMTDVWNQMIDSVEILRNIRDNLPKGKVLTIKSSRGLESAVSYEKYPDGIEVLHLASAPWNLDHLDSRLSGCGSTLLLKVFKEALKENCVVKVFPEKDAIPFYKKVGFSQTSVHKMIISIPAMKRFIDNMEKDSQKLIKEADFKEELDTLEAKGHMSSKNINIIQKDFGTADSGGFTPTYNYSGSDKKNKIFAAIKKIHESSINFNENKIDEIEDEAEEKEPKTPLQNKILGRVENFEEKMIQNFIDGYEKMAILSKEYSNEDLGELYNLAKSVNQWKSFNLTAPTEINRLEQVIFVDSIAHNLHKQKFTDGSSLYKQLDDLADISKSIGELNRGDRLLLLQSMQNMSKIKEYTHMDILQKSTMLEKSKSLWRLFAKAIKIGVDKLSNKELVILREWIYSKI